MTSSPPFASRPPETPTWLSEMDQRSAWLALASVSGLGPSRLACLLSACETPLGAISAPFAFLRAIPGLSTATAHAVRAARPEAGRRLLDQTAALGALVILPGEPVYPARLTELADPPLALFLLGEVGLLQRPAVAVVGSRDHTAYGADACRLVVAAASSAGLVVVSGMARGIDALAHAGALESGPGTIGVLGNGLGVIYPAANRQLYERVARQGLLLTEFPPGDRPRVHNFPRRNRLISGLAHVTVIVEAAHGSGALITAQCALEQGRDVMAVPGPITSPRAEGTNALLRDGAHPFLIADDLWAHYPALQPAARSTPLNTANTAAASTLPDDLGPIERHIAELIGVEARHVDEVVASIERGAGETLALLTALELRGVVEALPGGRYKRTS